MVCRGAGWGSICHIRPNACDAAVPGNLRDWLCVTGFAPLLHILQAAMIDKWEVGDIQTDKVFREIAEQQLGPILEVRHTLCRPACFHAVQVDIGFSPT